MGGFTKIQLKDVSQENIDLQNAKLDEIGLRKDIRFYSEKDIELEYQFFLKNEGYFPESQFPKHKIKSLGDFKRYWSPEALGDIFVPPIGALTFDCYFGRTSKRAMKMIGQYLINNLNQINSVSGSFSTFLERASLTNEQLEAIKETKFYQEY